MNIITIFIASILMVLLIPVIDAKPVIIGFTEEIDQSIIKEHGIADFTQHKIINAISAEIPESVSEKLKKNPKIKYVEEDAQVQIAGKPSQPQPPQPPQQITWGILRVKAPEVWNNSTGKNVKIAVLDAYGSGYISDVIEGIDWAVQNNMDIVSMSLGTSTYSQALNDTTANAYKAGTLLVAAAGNSGDGNLSTDDVLYPAKFDSVIAVSAIDYNNIAPVWSADGAEIELAAPGIDIYSTWLDGGYVGRSGTSMASPFVSGVAALIKSKNSSMTPEEIRDALTYNAVDLGEAGRDSVYGFGLVQAG